MDWKKDYTVPFVESYRRHEVLWNTTHPHYKVTSATDKAIESMVADIKAIVDPVHVPFVTPIKVEVKIKSIRSAYIKEVAKVVKSEKSGAGNGDVYKPQLFWFALADTFMRRAWQPRSSTSNLGVSTHNQDRISRLRGLRGLRCVEHDNPSVREDLVEESGIPSAGSVPNYSFCSIFPEKCVRAHIISEELRCN